MRSTKYNPAWQDTLYTGGTRRGDQRGVSPTSVWSYRGVTIRCVVLEGRHHQVYRVRVTTRYVELEGSHYQVCGVSWKLLNVTPSEL